MTVTRRMEIDAGHRLLRHESKCRHLHGHRYAFEVTVSAPELDGVGRVVDFGTVKTLVGSWLDEHWDHAFLVAEDDPLVGYLRQHEQRHAVLPYPPSAEHLAAHLFSVARALLPVPLAVVRVRCYETPNCWADAP